jgi:hypothetical protein
MVKNLYFIQIKHLFYILFINSHLKFSYTLITSQNIIPWFSFQNLINNDTTLKKTILKKTLLRFK